MPSIPLRERGERMDGTVVTPLRRTRSGYSQESIGRYSEHSLHSAYRLGGYSKSGKCQDCMSRIPYATLIATIMCCLGVLVFCAGMYRGVTLTSSIMFDQVFSIHLNWLSGLQLGFVIVGASMGALGIMILFVGCLATGATRHKVYRTWRGRVGGRISCAVFMGITYILQLVWIAMLCFLVIVTFIFSIFYGMCQSHRTDVTKCINFEMFDFMFPQNTPPEKMKVCGGDVKLFCKDSVELAIVQFVLATVACIIILLSLIHYLMCLSANYAHIRDHEKFQELQELQFLQDPTDMSTTSKDRF